MALAGEREVAKELCKKLRTWFEVSEEQVGEYVFGGNMRIDAILVPKFLSVPVRLGLEIKAFDTRVDVSLGDYAKHLKQSVDYTLCRFDGEPLDMVLAYPGILEGSTHNHYLRQYRHLAVRLMAPFRVGELRPYSGGFEITIGGSPLWRSRYGLTGVGERFHWQRR